MDEPIREVVRAAVGPIGPAVDHSWPHGVTRVWRVEAASGPVWVKRHGGAGKYRQEAAAYRTLVPRLAEAGVRVASLLAEDPGTRVLVLSHVDGWLAPTGEDLHRQAGRALAVLHGLPLEDPDPMPLAEALVARFAQWDARAAGALTSAEREAARRGFGEGPPVRSRVWCHRDFSPRNWLDDRGRLGWIDFEHCRPDHPFTDLLKLADGPWREAPSLRAAFAEGYPDLPPEEELRPLLWLHALSTVVWSVEHRDAGYEAHGRELLAALRRGDPALR